MRHAHRGIVTKGNKNVLFLSVVIGTSGKFCGGIWSSLASPTFLKLRNKSLTFAQDPPPNFSFTEIYLSSVSLLFLSVSLAKIFAKAFSTVHLMKTITFVAAKTSGKPSPSRSLPCFLVLLCITT
ncbi:hypothetical protein E2C01_037046 [Portunus trituberculatus]|uniref:Uncharacterized protein n=1 Tax=Portunus trituberculatus TaxID=210409 RepID=A0A5B7F742_PORTR|nr:hypothetical protein [Portunus trituberculatus]